MENLWNSELYDTKHKFVSRFGEVLIDLLKPQQDELILDLGCGTGDLAYKISSSGAKIIGIDMDSDMVESANGKYPHLEFMIMDARNLAFDCIFDGVFSNAAIHWIKEPLQVLRQVYSVLKPGGRFVAELGGKNNVKKVTDAIIESIRAAGYQFEDINFPWYYPTIGEYTSLMETAGFTVTYAVYFDRPTRLEDSITGLKDWIKMFGGSFLANVPPAAWDVIIHDVEKRLYSSLYIDGFWYADYRRIRVMGYK